MKDWVFVSREEQEFTAELAFAIAVALSWWAVRVGRAKLAIKSMPRPEEVGSRMGWTSIPASVMREDSMPVVARRLGLNAPVQSPGKWFPPEWLNDRCAARMSSATWGETVPRGMSVAEVQDWSPNHVYVGRDCRSSQAKGLVPSGWGNPFKVSVYGPQAAVTKYEKWLRSQPDLLKEIPKLRGCTLVCFCQTNQECHRRIIIKIYKEMMNTGERIYIGNRPGKGVAESGWESPFTVGPHGTPAECVVKYVAWLGQPGEAQQKLLQKVGSLRGKTLLCDCAEGQPCHGDYLCVLADQASDGWAGSSHPSVVRRRPRLVSAALLGVVARGYRQELEIPPVVQQRWPQSTLQDAIRARLPREAQRGFPMPILEDLVNSSPFTAFPEWLEQQGMCADGGLVRAALEI